MALQHDLIEELRLYQPADDAERAHHLAIIDLLGGGTKVFQRDHFEPGHITASCFIVDSDNTRLLLHRHRRLGKWLQMGGHCEGVEAPAVAALREGTEESGLADLQLLANRIFDIDVHEIPAAKGEPNHYHFDLRYVAHTSTPDAITMLEDESLDLTWVPFHEAIERMSEDGSTRAIRKIEQLLKKKERVI
jgi:8-oxo-dGTP pyrophosphatase MutT (NUDIX family)